MTKPPSPLDEHLAGLPGPARCELLTLAELVQWLGTRPDLQGPQRATEVARQVLWQHTAHAVFAKQGGSPFLEQPDNEFVPVNQGRRMLSRGLSAGPQSAPAARQGQSFRASCLQQLQNEDLAITKASASELFGWAESVAAPVVQLVASASPTPPVAVQVPDDPNPLGTLRDKVKGLTPIRKHMGSSRWPEGVDWRAELLRQYEQCKANGVSMDDVEAELAKLWALSPGSVHKYLSEARAARDKPQAGAGRLKA